MGLFSSYKPKITREELHRAISRIPGLEYKERQYIEDLFRGDIDESGAFQGIDRTELETEIQNLRENRKMHPSLTEDEIDRIQAALEKML